jgi:hypothetical protein
MASTIIYHQSIRALTTPEKLLAGKLRSSRVPMSAIVQMLEEQRGGATTYVHGRDVQNAISAQRREKLQGMSETAHFLQQLQSAGIWESEASIRDNQLVAIFFFDKRLMAKFRSKCQVIIMDATYKTNRFAMPLVLLHAIDEHGHTFLVAAALLHQETTEHYVWILEMLSSVAACSSEFNTIITDREKAMANAIAEVLPHSSHQLCIWHIEKNVTAKASTLLGSQKDEFLHSFRKCYVAATEDDFTLSWRECSVKYPSMFPYLDSHFVVRRQWGKCWTSRYKNYGVVSSQRAESAHAAIKHALEVTSPLSELLNVLHSQCQRYVQHHGFEQFRTENFVSPTNSQCMQLRTTMSSYAWTIVEQQVQIAREQTAYTVHDLSGGHMEVRHGNSPPKIVIRTESLSSCTCGFTFQFDLPCRHVLVSYFQRDQHVSSLEVGLRWRCTDIITSIPNACDIPFVLPPLTPQPMSSDSDRLDAAVHRLRELTNRCGYNVVLGKLERWLTAEEAAQESRTRVEDLKGQSKGRPAKARRLASTFEIVEKKNKS